MKRLKTPSSLDGSVTDSVVVTPRLKSRIVPFTSWSQVTKRKSKSMLESLQVIVISTGPVEVRTSGSESITDIFLVNSPGAR